MAIARRRPLRRPLRIGLLLAALAVLAGGAYLLRDATGLEWSAASVRETVEGFGLWAPLVLVAMLTFRFALMIPSQVLLIAGGLLFGALQGTLYGGLGLTLAALVNYVLVQWTGVQALRAQMPARMRGALEVSRSRAGALALAVVSGYPVGPVSLVHLVAATTGMTLVAFALAVGGGSLVRAGTYAYFGSTLFEGGRILIGSGVLLAAAALPLLHPRSRGWLRRSFLGAPSAVSDGDPPAA